MKPIRRSQAISPFGVGALVDFPGPVSLVHAGLDAWPFDSARPEHREFIINDEYRLARRLGVEYFVLPPDYRKSRARGVAAADVRNAEMSLPFLRFPRWHSCPRCGRMAEGEYHDNQAPTCAGPYSLGKAKGEKHKATTMTQVRFVAACPDGHLQDFPWLAWVFRGGQTGFDDTSMWLRLRSRGSASLAGIEITVEQRDASGDLVVVQRRTLAGAFDGDPQKDEPSALSKIVGSCAGHNPVLGVPSAGRPAEGCARHLYPLLRGAANLYSARVASAIYIPPGIDSTIPPHILEFLEIAEVSSRLKTSALGSESGMITARSARALVKELAPGLDGEIDAAQLAEAANRLLIPIVFFQRPAVPGALDQLIQLSPMRPLAEIVDEIRAAQFPDWAIDATELARHVAEHLKAERGRSGSGLREDMSESTFRYAEFKALRSDIDEGRPRRNLQVRSFPMSAYAGIVRSSFSRISLVHKLRETRAFCGFSRFFPDDRPGVSEQQWKLMALAPKPWLPAIEVRGEGIFVEFDEPALRRWTDRAGELSTRLEVMNGHLSDLRTRRRQQPRIASPRFVLLHTLAHAIINQLVYECGYGSAALRERIYEASGDESMAAVLIYTAAGDSEGTMGGLVAMGEPGRLEHVIAHAIERSRWCSSDPVCAESAGQGPGNCNLAACHACSLLPETACEEGNRLLDRAMLIGTIERPELGFFNERPGPSLV